jgi:hypothetical protein
MLYRRRQRRPRPAPGGDTAGEVVYFVRGGDAVKIGRTTNLAARLRALATASAVPLELLAAVPGGAGRRRRGCTAGGGTCASGASGSAPTRRSCATPASRPPGGRHPSRTRGRARAEELRRVLAALDPAGLAANGRV